MTVAVAVVADDEMYSVPRETGKVVGGGGGAAAGAAPAVADWKNAMDPSEYGWDWNFVLFENRKDVSFLFGFEREILRFVMSVICVCDL